MLKIRKIDKTEDVFDISVESNENFYANNILIHNCVEVTQPLNALYDVNDPNGEIGVCILAAVNMLKIKDDHELEQATDLIVRKLDAVIDHQDYFNIAAENFTKKRRSLGVGITNLAATLAKHKLKYNDPAAPNFVANFMEKMSYYLIKASNTLAKEVGPCEKFNLTKYSQGILPIDSYKRDIDEFVTEPLSMDWESLREDILAHGLRNSTLLAMMPVESSSVLQNSTNGIEPPRAPVVYKGSKVNILPVVVPEIDKYLQYYTFAFDMEDNIGYLKIAAAIQKFTDMSISTNTYYTPSRYANNKVPVEVVIKDLLTSYKYGIKSMYYANTDDGDNQSINNNHESGCADGACTL